MQPNCAKTLAKAVSQRLNSNTLRDSKAGIHASVSTPCNSSNGAVQTEAVTEGCNPIIQHDATEAGIHASVKHIQTEKQTEESKLICGTYCYPYLIPHIASWLSTDYAIKVSMIMTEYHVKEYKDKLAAAEEKLDECAQMLMETREDVFRLENACDNYQLDYKMAKAECNDAVAGCSAAKRARMKVEKKIDETLTSLNTKSVQFDAVTQELATWASTHSFTMLRLNDEFAKLPYYAIRCMNRNMQKRIIEIRRKHPNAIMVYQLSSVPNAINMYKRLRNSGKIMTQGCYCMPYITEADLIDVLGQLAGTVVPVMKPM